MASDVAYCSPQAPVATPARVTYQTVLRTGRLGWLMAATHLGRMPLGMAPIAILCAVAADDGSWAQRGALAAVYGVALAVGQPVLGQWADLRGQTPPLVIGAAVSSAALAALAVIDTTTWAAWLFLVAAGAAAPPLESCLRALIPRLLDEHPDQVRVAYSLDGSVQEAVYIAGPLLATALATAISPEAALLATAVLGLAGAAGVAASTSSRSWKPAPRHHFDRLGALRPSGVRVLVAAYLCIGVSIGAVTVAAMLEAEHHGAPWLTGTLPTVFSAGGLIGGLIYGARTWPGNHQHHLWVLVTAYALAWGLLLCHPAPHAAVALILLPGLLVVPIITAGSQVINVLAPRGTVTEAIGWLIGAINLGIAMGTAAGGRWQISYQLCAAAAAAAAITLLASDRFRTRPAPRQPHPSQIVGQLPRYAS